MARTPHGFNPKLALAEHGIEQSPSHKPGVLTDTVTADDIAYLEHYAIKALEPLGNKDLPVYEIKDEFLTTVDTNLVTVFKSPTGSGKSTQFPQMLYEAGWNVVITQPRRTAGNGVRERISEEISEKRGPFVGDGITSIHTGEKKEGPEDAPIQIVTDGTQVVLELKRKRELREPTVYIIDEAHEQGENVEILLAVLKEKLKNDPTLPIRIVVVSATIDPQKFADYLADVTPQPPAILELKNKRLHNLNIKENPDSLLVDATVQNCLQELENDNYLKSGPHGTLVFVPGKNETEDISNQIRLRLPPDLRKHVKIFPLHAKMSSVEQQKALTVYPNVIKIVVATNVAETSLTIPDIKYVVDSGLVKSMGIDQEGVRSLITKNASRAECMQRAGRCGRVADGHYTLARFSKSHEFVRLDEREPYSDPEIIRKEASRTMLRLATADYNLDDLDLINPIPDYLQKIGRGLLKLHGAFDDQDEVTELGEKMDRYPLDTVSTRIMVEGERFHDGIRSYLAAITAAREVGGLQRFGRYVGREWKRLTDTESSDLLVQLDLFIAAQHMKPMDLIEADLDISSIYKAQEHYLKVAKRAGVKQPPVLSAPTAEDLRDIEHCIITGYLPSVYEQIGPKQFVHSFNKNMPTIREISNRSVVSDQIQVITGDAYRVEISGDSPKTIHSIENVTATSKQQLALVAGSQAKLIHEDYKIQNGKAVETQRLMLHGMDLGQVVERSAPPTPKLRQIIIEHAINNPGSEQKRLKHIKKQLEDLDRKARGHVPRLTHDMILGLIDGAAKPDITHPSEIEDILRETTQGITLDYFVSPETVADINRESPDVFETEAGVFKLSYKNKKPVVSYYNAEDVLNLTEDLELPDGRVIKFYFKFPQEKHGRYYTASQLAGILRSQE